ncbi:hypothetical protein [Streptomyces sp. NPDC059597]|uniref:hypothetical protein n=1 Tax=Streptomyces sp. NPDC059597 TaxID=3346879 RepID=UPI0036ADA5F6
MRFAAETVCRVCGWDAGDARFDEFGCALHVICDCCGTESGHGDERPHQVRSLRQSWLDNGAPWFKPERRPPTWDRRSRLAAVPPRWR